MRWAPVFGTALLTVLVATIVFSLFERGLSRTIPSLAVPNEILLELEASLGDLKRLAELDPAGKQAYRARFEAVEAKLQRLRVLDASREAMERRYRLLLLGIFLISIVLSTALYAWRQARLEPRLQRLRAALEDLALGERELALAATRSDVLGRIEAMVEEVSASLVHHRRRLASMEHLEGWQEGTRRLAHEMRTPMTAAELELGRLAALLEREETPSSSVLAESVDRTARELRRLGDFSQRFAGFARLPSPTLVERDLAREVREFVATFGQAWPGLRLETQSLFEAQVSIDPALLRQVWVNLCDNAAHASSGDSGRVVFRMAKSGNDLHLDFEDNGPGVPIDLRDRLFDPYVSGSPPGEGIGLGLAISRKILLDHGGDLELVDSLGSGACFRLVLPQSRKR